MSLLCSVLVIGLLLPQGLYARVLINEVMWAGSDISTADEWVELITDQDMDVSGWTLTTLDSKGEEDVIHTFANGSVIGSGAYFLISNYAAAESRLSVTPNIVTTKVSLPNTKLLLRLRDADGNIMDEVDDFAGAPFAGSNNPKASMERRRFDLSGILKESWQTAITSLGFDDGPEIYGTPGFSNSMQEAPVSSSSSGNASPVIMQSNNECFIYSGSGIIVNEILPAPSGRDEDGEWIEIKNILPRWVDLCGWKLDDSEKGSRPFPLDEFELSPGQILLFHRIQTKIALNDDGDSVRLIDPFGRVSFEKWYEKETKDQSLSLRGDGLWLWTEFLTPGQENRFRTGDRAVVPNTVIIHAVLPNPVGTDEGQEWIELRNTTNEPLLLNDWKLRLRSGRTIRIKHLRMRAREIVRLQGERLPVTLSNDGGSITLLTPDEYTVALLSWDEAEDEMVTERRDAVRYPAVVREVKGARLIVSLSGEPGDYRDIFAVSLRGIDAKTSDQEVIKAHLQDKNIELEFDSSDWKEETDRRAEIFFSNGDSLQNILLRQGSVIVDTHQEGSHEEEYMLYEQEARDARLGLWSDESFITAIASNRDDEKRFAIYKTEGFMISTDPLPGLLHVGSGISLTTNIPGAIFASINGGEFRALTGSVAMTSGSMIVTAFAETQIDQEKIQTEPAVFTFIEQKKNYSEDVRITEVFPAPGKNPQGEWIEVRNLSSTPVYLAGWRLDDQKNGGSKPWNIHADTVILPKGFVTFASRDTQLALNDAGDDVYLIAPDGSVVSSISYAKIKRGQSIAFRKIPNEAYEANAANEARHCITDVPTPGFENFCYSFLPEKIAPDSDHDFLPDDREIYAYHTDPFNPDSDGDLWIDGFEVAQGTDPISSTEESRTMLAAYRDFIEERLKPRWRLFKKKGLTLTAKSYPFIEANIAVAGEAWKLLSDSTEFERIITRSLPRGEHTFPLHLRDLAGRQVFLASAYRITLSEPYAYAPRTAQKVKGTSKRASPRRRVSPALADRAGQSGVTEDQDIFDRIGEQRSLIASLLAGQGTEDEHGGGGNSYLGIAVILFWICAAIGLWLWGRRK